MRLPATAGKGQWEFSRHGLTRTSPSPTDKKNLPERCSGRESWEPHSEESIRVKRRRRGPGAAADAGEEEDQLSKRESISRKKHANRPEWQEGAIALTRGARAKRASDERTEVRRRRDTSPSLRSGSDHNRPLGARQGEIRRERPEARGAIEAAIRGTRRRHRSGIRTMGSRQAAPAGARRRSRRRHRSLWPSCYG